MIVSSGVSTIAAPPCESVASAMTSTEEVVVPSLVWHGPRSGRITITAAGVPSVRAMCFAWHSGSAKSDASTSTSTPGYDTE